MRTTQSRVLTSQKVMWLCYWATVCLQWRHSRRMSSPRIQRPPNLLFLPEKINLFTSSLGGNRTSYCVATKCLFGFFFFSSAPQLRRMNITHTLPSNKLLYRVVVGCQFTLEKWNKQPVYYSHSLNFLRLTMLTVVRTKETLNHHIRIIDSFISSL